ncbi:MAG: hypothetical protein OXG54_09955 [Gammaproteobacteria bacterium]|nr:hypothetical protein [Gammaproteobacteria bacterium]
MTPREIAERYVELLNSGRFDEVGELWADDGGSLKTDPEPFSPASVDLFKVNADGKVQKMIAYIAPPNKWLTH